MWFAPVLKGAGNGLKSSLDHVSWFESNDELHLTALSVILAFEFTEVPGNSGPLDICPHAFAQTAPFVSSCC